MKMSRRGTACAALVVLALATFGFVSSASAKLTGAFTVFQQCPWTNPEAVRCIAAVTEGGEVVLGNKKVPIENPVTLQGGLTKQVSEVAKMIAAKNGETLTRTPQNVPGGLLGIVPEEKSPPLVKALIKFFFENSLTGVSSTLELARPASEVLVSEPLLIEEEGTALKLPIKVHLENPFLGKNCFVGSNSSPIFWNLTSGTTSPPEPNKPIKGKAGKLQFLEEATMLRLTEDELVDNAWSAPSATGCGGIISFLVTPIINSQIGLPSAAGYNTAILKNTVSIAPSSAVKTNDEKNP